MKNPELVEAVRRGVDIVQIISEVVPLKKSGSNYFGVCPFHNEKSPSLSVSSSKQLFHCFGCKVGGDVIKFVQLYYRWDFTASLEELGRRAGIQVESIQKDPDWEEGFAILDFTARLFEENLASENAEKFKTYLEGRKIQAKQIEEFRLGAHLGGPTEISDAIHKKSLSRDIAVRIGVLGRSSRGDFIDRFQDRLIFPILDEKARIRGFGGRSLQNEHPKYINSPKSTHFDKGRLFYGMHLATTPISKKTYAVLVEGYLDVISLHEYGVTNAIGSMGTALTNEQVRVLKRHTSRVISLYDSDRAGLAATEKNLGNFFKEGLEAKVVTLPDAKDPDALLHDEKRGRDEKNKILRKAFETSTSAVDYLVQNTVLVEKTASVRGQKLRALVSLLDQIPDEIERAIVKKDLAKRFELSEDLLNPIKPSQERLDAAPKPNYLTSSTAGSDRFEREILRFLVQYGELGAFSLTEAIPYLSSASKWASLLLRFVDLQLESKTIAGLDWLQAMDLPADDSAKLREWALEEKGELGQEETANLWKDILAGLRKSYLHRESERIQKEIAVADEKNDHEGARALLAEKQDLARLFNSLN